MKIMKILFPLASLLVLLLLLQASEAEEQEQEQEQEEEEEEENQNPASEAQEQELLENQAKWEAFEWANYDFNFQQFSIREAPFSGYLLVEVTQHQIESVFWQGQDVTDEVADSILTLTELFKVLQLSLDAFSFNVTYDEKYGYPTTVNIDYEPMVADDELVITISNVVRLLPQPTATPSPDELSSTEPSPSPVVSELSSTEPSVSPVVSELLSTEPSVSPVVSELSSTEPSLSPVVSELLSTEPSPSPEVSTYVQPPVYNRKTPPPRTTKFTNKLSRGRGGAGGDASRGNRRRLKGRDGSQRDEPADA